MLKQTTQLAYIKGMLNIKTKELIMVAKKGSCGKKPRVGKVGDAKPKGRRKR